MINDGRCIIELAPDAMSASITLSPAAENGRALSYGDVEFELRTAGITEGVNWDLVKKTLEACNTEHKVYRNIVIARGEKPRPAVPACLVFPPKIQVLDPLFLPAEQQATNLAPGSDSVKESKEQDPEDSGPEADQDRNPEAKGFKGEAGAVDEHGTMDFRETHGVFIIHEGQVLAVERPAVEGLPGKTVRGEYVPFTTLKVAEVTAGDNTEKREENRIYATKNGRLDWNSKSFWVEETLVLSVDVGYRTGNIRFPGNLVLKASIKDRFKVWVGGNLEASGVIDAFEVFCGGNMVAKGGIIGRGKGLIRAKGSLDTRFVEHCTVETIGPLMVELTSLNATLFSADFIRTSDKGKIVGGESHAYAGMEVYNIGNSAGAATSVWLGENYVVHRKLEYAREKFQELTLAVQQISERIDAIAKAQGPRSATLEEHRARLIEERNKYERLMNEAVGELADRDDVALVVKGSCFPGVVVHIGSEHFETTTELKNVRIARRPPQGKIAPEPLQVAKASQGSAAKSQQK